MTRRLIWIQSIVAVVVLIGIAVTQAAGYEMREFKFREDFGSEALSDCYMNYYYYIRYDPPTSGSYFWYFTGWTTGDMVGEWFQVGDVSMWTGLACDPVAGFTLEQVRILDFAGYGTVYPGWFSVTFDVYCSDEQGCPIGPSLHTTPPIDTGYGWWYIDIDPDLCLPVSCAVDPGPPPSGPRILITAMHTGSMGSYPAWGADNISSNFLLGAPMHDESCLPALYPRPYVSHYNTMHSGWYLYYGGPGFYCPPEWFLDGRDTADGQQWGFIELAWRIYLGYTGPTAAVPSTWGSIKSMYR